MGNLYHHNIGILCGLVPWWYGMASVKWLKSITVIDHRFKGYFMRTYSNSIKEHDSEVSQPVTAIKPRALINPPGVPHFFTRVRYLEPGDHILNGKAWVGGSTSKKQIEITDIKISLDNALTWNSCTITGQRKSHWGWYSWEYHWKDAKLGNYVIIVRATDSENLTQPLESQHDAWDYRSMGNNVAQKMVIHVTDFKTLEYKQHNEYNTKRMQE